MTDYYNKPDRDCPPTGNPAPQPNAPTGGCHPCEPLPITTPPTVLEPRKCPDPPAECNCPPPATNPTNCLEKAIAEQAKRLAQADRAKAFKTDLEGRLQKATAAAQQYTQGVYEALLRRWQEEDRAIVELIRKLTCAVPCWRCLIECYVCPILNGLRDNEQRLYSNGDGTVPATVNNLYDLQYWLTRDSGAKEATVARITKVLDAWASPAATIAAVLDANSQLLVSCNQTIGTAPGGVVFDVFLKLVPMHLAIAPPRVPDDPKTTTGIDIKYTLFCGCDVGKPDAECCGPNTGILSLRQRILGVPPVVGPQPYLVKPGELFPIICCLVEKRYRPAKDAHTEAAALLTSTTEEIARRELALKDGLGLFEKNARAAIPTQPECCDCHYDARKQAT